MNTDKQIQELTQIMKEMDVLGERLEQLRKQMDEEYERLAPRVQESDYGYALEDLRDAMDDVLFDGVKMAHCGINEIITDLKCLNCESKTSDYDDYVAELDEDEDAVPTADWQSGITSAILGHHLTQRKQHGKEKGGRTKSSAIYNPFDTHGESSFDWEDCNEDGYDDRDDGFWTEREF